MYSNFKELLEQHNNILNNIVLAVDIELDNFANTFFAKYPYLESVQIAIHDSGFNDGDASYTVIEEPTLTFKSIEMLNTVTIESLVTEKDYNNYVEYLNSDEKFKGSYYTKEELEELIHTYENQNTVMSKNDLTDITTSLEYLNTLFTTIPDSIIASNYTDSVVVISKEGVKLEEYNW